MSSGITFSSYREAREYQQILLREGTNSNLERRQGQYIVTPKGKTNIEIIEVGKDAIGSGALQGIYLEGEHGSTILIESSANTAAKLHELGHAAGHHKGKGATLGIDIDREIDAEIYAWRKQGRELNYRIGINALLTWFNKTKVWKEQNIEQIRSAINEVSRKMEAKGISVTRENKEDIVDILYSTSHSPEAEEAKKRLRELL